MSNVVSMVEIMPQFNLAQLLARDNEGQPHVHLAGSNDPMVIVIFGSRTTKHGIEGRPVFLTDRTGLWKFRFDPLDPLSLDEATQEVLTFRGEAHDRGDADLMKEIHEVGKSLLIDLQDVKQYIQRRLQERYKTAVYKNEFVKIIDVAANTHGWSYLIASDQSGQLLVPSKDLYNFCL